MSLPMPTVNLLPWRLERRRQRCRTFNVLLIGLLVMAVLTNVGVVVVMDHHTQALAAINEDLTQQLDPVLAERDRVIDTLPEFEPRKHWFESGQWLEELASTTPEGVRWRALQWRQSSDQWQLHFEALELAVVAPWADAWAADVEVSEQRDEGVSQAVMTGQLSSLLALHWEPDHALVD